MKIEIELPKHLEEWICGPEFEYEDLKEPGERIVFALEDGFNMWVAGQKAQAAFEDIQETEAIEERERDGHSIN